MDRRESFEWGQVRGGTARRGTARGDVTSVPERQWSYEVGREPPTEEPVVATTEEGRSVFVVGRDGVYAVDESGGERFRFETEGRVGASPAVADVDGPTLFVPTSGDVVVAVDATTGDSRWEATVQGCHSSPAVVDGTVYVGSDDDGVYALDADTGDVEWVAETDGMVRLPPAVDEGVVYAATAEGTLYAFDADTGDQAWANGSETGSIAAAPAVSGSFAFVSEAHASRNRSGAAVHAHDVETGDRVWTAETEGNGLAAPAVGDGAVFVGCSDGVVYGLDADRGEKLWTFEAEESDDLRPPATGDPAVWGDTVVVGDSEGRLYGVDADTGDEHWTLGLEEEELSIGPVVHDGWCYFGTEAGRRGRLVTVTAEGADTGGTEFGSNEAIDAPTVETQLERGDWQVPGGNPGRTGHRDGTAPTEALVPGWELERRGRANARHDVAIDGDRLYAYGRNGDHLRAYSLSDGAKLWTATEVTPYDTPPVVADGTVYAGSQSDGTLYAFDAEGQTQWQWDCEGRGAMTAPAVAGDRIALTVGETLSVLSADGEQAWQSALDGEGSGSPLFAYGTLYVTAGGTLYGLDPRNGTERFAVEAGATTAPAVGDGEVFVGVEGGIAGFDAETGTRSWQGSIDGAPRPPAVRDGVAYVTTDEGVLKAFDTADGRERWQFAAGDRLSPPAVDGDTVLVASADPGHGGDDENLYALDAETGEVRYRYELDDVSDPGRPVVADGTVVLAPGRESVLALAAGEGVDPTAAETDGWTGRGSGPAATNYAGGGGPGTGAETAWEVDLGYRVQGSAIVEDGVVFVPTARRELAAYDAATGETLWTTELGSIDGTPVARAGTAYAALSDGTLKAVDADTGEVLWSFEGDAGSFSGFRSTPALSSDGETLFVGSDDEHLYAVDADTGEQRWTFDAGDAGAADEEIGCGPVVAGDVVYVAATYTVFGVDAETGTKLWSYEASHPEGIAVADGRVFVGADRAVLALDAETGTEGWSVETPGIASAPAVAADAVYTCSEESVFALAAADGSERWRCEVGGQNELAPAVADGVVYAGGTEGTLFAVEDGELAFSVDLGDRARFAGAPVVANGTVYAVDGDGGTLTAVGDPGPATATDVGAEEASDNGESGSEAGGEGVVETGNESGVKTGGEESAETHDEDDLEADSDGTPPTNGTGDPAEAATDTETERPAGGSEGDAGETGSEEPREPSTDDDVLASEGSVDHGGPADESGWATGRGNGRRTGAVGSGPTADDSHRWECAPDGNPAGIAAADGTAYLSTSDGEVLAVDLHSGEDRWTFECEKAVSAPPAVVDGCVYVPSQDEHLYALDRETGERLWAFESEGSFGRFTTTPAVADGVVYAACADSTLYAIDAEAGEKLWSHEKRRDFTASPVVAHGLVYARCDDDTLYAIDSEDGTERWAHDLGTGYGGGESVPALSGDAVYVGNDGGDSFYALDAATGTQRWHVELDGSPVETPAIADGTAYVCCEDDAVRALDAESGTVVWSAGTDGTPANSPAVADGVVYTATGSAVEGFDAEDGTARFAIEQDGTLDPSPVVADGAVIVGGRTFDAYGSEEDGSPDETADSTPEASTTGPGETETGTATPERNADPAEDVEEAGTEPDHSDPFAKFEGGTESASTEPLEDDLERHYVTTAADDAEEPSDEQVMEAILGILCDEWQGRNRDASLSLEYVTEAVTGVLPGASPSQVEHGVRRLDEQGAVDFESGFGTVSLRPPGVVRYDELSEETVLPERRLVEVLEPLYERARDEPEAPRLSREELRSGTYLDADELDRTVWFLKAVGLQLGDVYVDDPDVGGYVDVHAVGDAPWWRSARITAAGKDVYEDLTE